jgi:hypothetical protein
MFTIHVLVVIGQESALDCRYPQFEASIGVRIEKSWGHHLTFPVGSIEACSDINYPVVSTY